MLVNFGPCHPAAHGVLRISLWLQNEIQTSTEVLQGLLHRASTDLMCTRTYEQIHGYLSRTDYVAYLHCELTWLSISNRSDRSNVDHMINSITLLLNHGLNCGCLLGDTGCVSTIL